MVKQCHRRQKKKKSVVITGKENFPVFRDINTHGFRQAKNAYLVKIYFLNFSLSF